MKVSRIVFICLVIFTTIHTNLLCAAPPQREPTPDNYRDWIRYIRPSADEEKWRHIAWRNRLMPAVAEAKKLERPILLWAMNGNPCGET